MKPFKPRNFVPAQINWGEWSQIEPLFDALEKRAAECKTVQDLERWLLAGSELMAAFDEEGSRRYIAMTCHTENPEAEKAYLHFVENIEPQIKPRQFRLSEIYLKHPLRKQLPKQRYEVFDRDRQVHVDLFRQENVPLQTEEAKLGQQYQKLSGSLT
ncbi:MAG TPA: M3 family oligoendopeptidase, partial [Verrucomicrobiae bacterium]|nr:M3 family oligoendopeptidase [Verrucomicrobiae bacterium]